MVAVKLGSPGAHRGGRRTGTGKWGYWMWFLFVCGWCGEDNAVFCARTGFWGTRFEDPEEFDCWRCEGTSWTPDGPWTPAE